jgi:hydrogenase maturation factor HypF (carbamoyltransferase family)
VSERVRGAVRVEGTVQGVGFRPFVYGLATQLVLSVRTVDNNLQNAYTKLGMTSHDELARLLGASEWKGALTAIFG